MPWKAFATTVEQSVLPVVFSLVYFCLDVLLKGQCLEFFH